MKIYKWVDIGQEVEIEIGFNDVRVALAESFAQVTKGSPGETGMLLAFNQIAMFMKAVTVKQIGMLNVQQRKIIGDFLAEQAKRFI